MSGGTLTTQALFDPAAQASRLALLNFLGQFFGIPQITQGQSPSQTPRTGPGGVLPQNPEVVFAAPFTGKRLQASIPAGGARGPDVVEPDSPKLPEPIQTPFGLARTEADLIRLVGTRDFAGNLLIDTQLDNIRASPQATPELIAEQERILSNPDLQKFIEQARGGTGLFGTDGQGGVTVTGDPQLTAAVPVKQPPSVTGDPQIITGDPQLPRAANVGGNQFVTGAPSGGGKGEGVQAPTPAPQPVPQAPPQQPPQQPTGGGGGKGGGQTAPLPEAPQAPQGGGGGKGDGIQVPPGGQTFQGANFQDPSGIFGPLAPLQTISPLQQQATSQLGQFINQPAPETRAFESAFGPLQNILSGGAPLATPIDPNRGATQPPPGAGIPAAGQPGAVNVGGNQLQTGFGGPPQALPVGGAAAAAPVPGGVTPEAPGFTQGLFGAINPVFEQNLRSGLAQLSAAAPGRFGSAFAQQGTNLAQRSISDFNLFASQLAQQQQANQIQAALGLGQLGLAAGQGPFGRQLGAGQFGLQQSQFASQPAALGLQNRLGVQQGLLQLLQSLGGQPSGQVTSQRPGAFDFLSLLANIGGSAAGAAAGGGLKG